MWLVLDRNDMGPVIIMHHHEFDTNTREMNYFHVTITMINKIDTNINNGYIGRSRK